MHNQALTEALSLFEGLRRFCVRITHDENLVEMSSQASKKGSPQHLSSGLLLEPHNHAHRGSSKVAAVLVYWWMEFVAAIRRSWLARLQTSESSVALIDGGRELVGWRLSGCGLTMNDKQVLHISGKKTFGQSELAQHPFCFSLCRRDAIGIGFYSYLDLDFETCLIWPDFSDPWAPPFSLPPAVRQNYCKSHADFFHS